MGYIDPSMTWLAFLIFFLVYPLFLLLFLAVYVYFAAALMTVAKKTRTEPTWLAWIPIANLYLMSKIAKYPWWTVLIIIPGAFIPLLGPIAAMVVMVMWVWRICELRKKPGWLSLLMVLPLANLVVLGVLAWSD